MKIKISRTIACILTCIIIVLLSGCISTTSQEDIYHHKSEYSGPQIAKDLEVWTDNNGSLEGKALSNNASIPSEISVDDAVSGSIKRSKMFPDALGSQNIKIKIDEAVGYTEFAGLKFKKEATINIWKDGTIEVDHEGIEATDVSGTRWISKKIGVDGKNVIVIVKGK
jgi:hypothetical protein